MNRLLGVWMLVGWLALGCDAGGEQCVAGMTIECPCLGGGSGIQTCQADGTFAACQCLDAGGAADSGRPRDAGEVEDARIATDSGAADTGAPDARVDSATDPCAGHVTYAGAIANAGPAWGALPSAAGLTGYEAGVAACAAIGADHPCDYEEVVTAAAAGELSAIPAGTTAWLHRTTTVSVGGADSLPGPGARCNDWTFTGNHIADGEYVTFETMGVATYHFDPDPVFDPAAPGEHVVAGDLDCGGVVRSIFCCYPACSAP